MIIRNMQLLMCSAHGNVELKLRYEKLNLHQTPIHKIFSEASLGKAYFKEIGIKSWRESQPDFPNELIGILMSSYYGDGLKFIIEEK